MKKSLKSVADFLFEAGILSKTPRSFHFFLGSGKQSVAEHTNRVMFVGYVLASLAKGVDLSKVLKMCLFHDLAEARTSDLNYVHQKYISANEEQATLDLAQTLKFGDDILKTLAEYNERKSPESLLAKDVDQIEFILSLKEEMDTGNTRAKSWIPSAVKRLKTKVAQDIAKEIIKTNSDDWWFSNKEDSYWVHRNKEVNKNPNEK